MPRVLARFVPSSVLCALVAGAALAHTSLGEYVQHRYGLAISAKNIDLTVELAFNGDPAKAARASMDTDRDGVISRDEQRTYVAKWEKLGVDQVRVLCNAADISVVTLYAPELDLEDECGVGRHPFIVRLRFFARTPGTLTPGAPLRIESSLQLATPALVSLDVSGDTAAPVTIQPGHGDTLPALKSGSRVFEIRCPKFDLPANAATLSPRRIVPDLRLSERPAASRNQLPSETLTKSTTGDHGYD
ncbi:MAG: hypothetical protein HZB26_01455 [Candidatus Hydrogenedentes bacterium]|nr:hypothetical protein [Candidatus Hydrogenedentota bacterium]